MKNLTFALACASTFALFAKIEVPTAGFESPYEAGNKVVGAGSLTENGATFWFYDGASGSEDGSTVKAYGGDNLAAPTTGDDPGTQYLELSTEGGTLWRSLAAGNTAATDIADKLGDAQGIPDGGLYIDTMVQFTPTEDGGAPDTTGGDKLAIWLNVDSSGEAPMTNLCVKARQVSGAECDGIVDPLGTIYNITNVVPQPGTWYRLTVKAVSDLTSYGLFGGFQIFLDNTVLVADKMTVDGEAYGTLSGDTSYCSTEKLALITEKKVFASLVDLTGLQAVGFKGSGALDNLAITAQDPLPAPGEMIDFTITAGANTTVTWSTDGKTWTDYVAGAQAPAGRLYVRLTNADGATKILTKTLGSDSNSFDVSAETFGWAEYLGEAIDGAYVIDNVAELVMFQKGVATLGSEGVTFKLGADLDMANQAWAGIGVKGGVAFNGTFDGAQKTISNLTLPRQTYAALFNNIGSTALIKDVIVDVVGFADGDVSEYGGAAIVGYSEGGATIEGCTATGAFAGTHNVAGICCRTKGDITLKNCVNAANITTSYSKIGGMIAISESGTVVFEGCENTGCITADGVYVVEWKENNVKLGTKERSAGADGVSGLLAYEQGAGMKVSFLNCKSMGTVQAINTKSEGSYWGLDGVLSKTAKIDQAQIASFKACGTKAVYETVSGNQARADLLAVKSQAVNGLNFATIAGDVATFVEDSVAVAGANLKVMSTKAPEVKLANIGDAITLDTTLATVTVTTTAENAEVKQEGNVYTVVEKSAAEDWPEDPSTVTGQTAGKAYGITGELADAEADKLAIWAKANGAPYVGATEAIKVEAYLLNVANTDAAIADGKANFKIPAITVDANGTVTVTDPEGSYNGKITIKGSVTVNGTYDLDKADATARFFKAFLSVK